MVKGVANVWVPVEDIQRALDFYQNTLDFSVINTMVLGLRSTPTGSTLGSTAGSPRERRPEAVLL